MATCSEAQLNHGSQHHTPVGHGYYPCTSVLQILRYLIFKLATANEHSKQASDPTLSVSYIPYVSLHTIMYVHITAEYVEQYFEGLYNIPINR